jgi:hypothetical protein
MIHFIHVSMAITRKHVGWCAGFCPHRRQLEGVSHEYSGPVQRAVQAVRETADLAGG